MAAFYVVGLLLDDVPAFEPAATLLAASPACTGSEFFSAAGSPLSSTTDVRMYENTYVRKLVCSPSVLTLGAEGTAGGGVGARLVVSLGSEVLFNQPLVGRHELTLELEEPAWLMVAFTNDYFQPPEDRNLALFDLKVVPYVREGED